ncbi:major facilitator superfamily domain-containing protein [Gigaspora rosea]|uniref:Major facilitator superfamily domain-containing protein n=1 Tax=Gigaspora rosea TaxID=44941 RepID=A0A397VLV8_9GLOM|nr:major facilitator superfamily domain-containing protein [Gigaspora rosea]
MSIAIVYMAKEFNWDHSIQGYVSSAFYIGYFTTLIIGGVIADKFGGKRVLSVGIGEGPTYSCIQSIISKWFPPEEQPRAVSLICVSNFIGMIISMPISNLLGSSQFGWESIFWAFAIIGSIWSVIWHFYGRSDPRDYPGISKEELGWILKNKSTVCSEDNLRNYPSGSREYITIIDHDHSENDMLLSKNQISSRPSYAQKIPWKLILSHREVWAILLCQFFNSWSFFTMLSWLPIFYYEYFHVDIHLIGFYTALPYLSYVIMGSIVGYICDYSIHQLKIRVIIVRRSANIIASLGISMILLSITYLAKTSVEGLLMITIGFALYSFQNSSFLVSHLDIAPKYAGVICGLATTCAMIPAFFAVALTGWILEVTNDWNIIWRICSLCNIIGIVFYVSWVGGENNPKKVITNR